MHLITSTAWFTQFTTRLFEPGATNSLGHCIPPVPDGCAADLEDPGRVVGKQEVMESMRSRQMLEHPFEMGRGGIYLRLTPEQYWKLR